MNARAGFFSKRPEALAVAEPASARRSGADLHDPRHDDLAVAGVPARLAVHFQYRAVRDGAARQHVHAEAARLRRVPERAAVLHAAAAVAERGIDADRVARRPHRSRCRRPGDRIVRPLPRGRKLRGRYRGVRDPDDHQLHGDHEGRGADCGSGRALHARRHAGQADGDRRRPERRSHQRRSGEKAPPAGGAGSRVLRLHGRRQQVRARRCDRGLADHGDQHRRRA